MLVRGPARLDGTPDRSDVAVDCRAGIVALATWSIASLDRIAWVALVLGTLAVLSPLPIIGRVAGALLVACCLSRPPLVAEGGARLTILDVGQGLSVVVETRGHTLVYDAGPSFRTGSDTGQLVVVPFLKARGIRTVDRVVVSHDDDDHKGGAGSVLALMATRGDWGQACAQPGSRPAPPTWRRRRVGAARRGPGTAWGFAGCTPAIRGSSATTTVRACCWSAPEDTRRS